MILAAPRNIDAVPKALLQASRNTGHLVLDSEPVHAGVPAKALAHILGWLY